MYTFFFLVLTNSSGGDGQSIYGFSTPKRKDALAKIGIDFIIFLMRRLNYFS